MSKTRRLNPRRDPNFNDITGRKPGFMKDRRTPRKGAKLNLIRRDPEEI